MTLNVILCALFVSSPERTVWTLPRNDWWARGVTAAIHIKAWSNEMFKLNFFRYNGPKNMRLPVMPWR